MPIRRNLNKSQDKREEKPTPKDYSNGDTSGTFEKEEKKKWWLSFIPLSSTVPQTYDIFTVTTQESSTTDSAPNVVVVEGRDSRPSTTVTIEDSVVVRGRAYSDPFNTVYPQRCDKEESIGTNPVESLSYFHKSRLGLDSSLDDSGEEEYIKEENDTEYIIRCLKEIYQSYFVLPTKSCTFCCRTFCSFSTTAEELELIFQPRTHHSFTYLKKFQDFLKEMPEQAWRKTVHDNLVNIVACSIGASTHLVHLTDIMDQFTSILAFSDIYMSSPVTEKQKLKVKGRSVIGGFVWMMTFIIGQLESTDERSYKQLMRYIQTLFEELVAQDVLLWTAICHMTATTEIILHNMENALGTYLFHAQAMNASVIDLRAREAYRDQQRVRIAMRREKKLRETNIMIHKTSWSSRVRFPSLLNLKVLSKIERSNEDWHSLSHFNFKEQCRIIINLIKRTKDMMAEAFVLLSDYDRILHTHRPSRKKPVTDTLFEDSIYLKDRFISLNNFPTNLLKKDEVEYLYELGRILGDKIDELYIAIFGAKDIAREGAHVVQLCYEYLRVHGRWDMLSFHDATKKLQIEQHNEWDHFPGFPAFEKLHIVQDPIPLFNASIYSTIVKIYPVKVAKLLLTVRSPKEIAMERRRISGSGSSHSLWDAFDTIPNNRYLKHQTPLNKEEPS